MKKTIIPEIKKEFINKLADEGTREDGRNLAEIRTLNFDTGVIGTANGSARLSLGKTDIMVGVKLQIGTPYPDKPDQGVLMTGCELKPMAHPTFDGGAPSVEAVEIARVVDRGIRESGMMDMHAFCITPGEKVWMVYLDIQVLNYDGNLFDAATMAGVLALHNTIVPAAANALGENYPLPVTLWPLTATFVKINNHLMIDPTFTEEHAADARLTISIDDNGDIRAMQKGLKGALTYDEVIRALDIAQELTQNIRASLQKSTGV